MVERRLPDALSLLMPVCNEIGVIAEVVEEWHREVMQFVSAGSEMIFDDGASTDGTLDKLDELKKTYPYIRVLRSARDGFAASARRLYREARCPLVFFTDSDGQYVPAEFWKVAQYIDTFDMVHGAKINRQDPVIRRVASAFFNRISDSMLAPGIRDINSAFRLVRRPLILEVLPQAHCMPTLLNAELLLRMRHAGYSIKQVDVIHRPRRHGASRGLPPARFARECLNAYRGLKELRRELRAHPAAARSATPVSPATGADGHPA